MKTSLLRVLCAGCALFAIVGASSADDEHVHVDSAQQPGQPGYAYATNGVVDELHGAFGATWKVVIDESNLGGKELEAAEVRIPAGTAVPSHTHNSVEVIYVLSGTYGHEVNGKLYLLKPGMVGIVRPGDKVRHLVPRSAEAKLLILWVPAGEAKQLTARGKGTPMPPVPVADKLDQ